MAKFVIPSIILESVSQISAILGVSLGIPAVVNGLPEEKDEKVEANVEFYFPETADGFLSHVTINASLSTWIYTDEEVESARVRMVEIVRLQVKAIFLGRESKDLVERVSALGVQVSDQHLNRSARSFVLAGDQIKQLIHGYTTRSAFDAMAENQG